MYRTSMLIFKSHGYGEIVYTECKIRKVTFHELHSLCCVSQWSNSLSPTLEVTSWD